MRNLAILIAIFAAGAGPVSGRTFTSLYSFGGHAHDAVEPQSPLAIGQDGVLYGTTVFTANAGRGPGDGIMFALHPPASPGSNWTLHILHEFTGTGGADPWAGLVKDSEGIFYGTTQIGGAQNFGTVFSFKP